MSDALVRADGVIRGLLDFSAPKQLDVKRASLNVIINQALRLVRGEMKGCTIQRELQSDLPPLALDTDKISQVFVNLLTNARRLAEQGNEAQQAAAGELLPALEIEAETRKAARLERAAAKRAATRELGSRCSDPEGAELEAALSAAVNQLGVGPQGLGGMGGKARAVHAALERRCGFVVQLIECCLAVDREALQMRQPIATADETEV
mgnify:CR=1 FL=1